MLLIFDNKEERTRASRLLSKHSNKPVPDPLTAAAAAQALWLTGSGSNFAYLLELNLLAGRSFNDLTQYPVFPWVIAQYGTQPLVFEPPGGIECAHRVTRRRSRSCSEIL